MIVNIEIYVKITTQFNHVGVLLGRKSSVAAYRVFRIN
jgi:hypothetical protein